MYERGQRALCRDHDFVLLATRKCKGLSVKRPKTKAYIKFVSSDIESGMVPDIALLLRSSELQGQHMQQPAF